MNQHDREELQRLAWEAVRPSDKVTGAPPPGTTKMWEIEEAPEYQLEQTPGLWVLWGKCEDLDEECSLCGGTGDKVLATCGLGENVNQSMVKDITGLEVWTPKRIQ